MKSAHCKTRWHDKCQKQIEYADGSADICQCSCHIKRSDYGLVTPYYEIAAESPQFEPPPPHPQPFDHRRFLLAFGWDNGDKTGPWLWDYCVNGSQCEHIGKPIWTFNKREVENHEVLCEDCGLVITQQIDSQQPKRTVRRWHDPFASR